MKVKLQTPALTALPSFLLASNLGAAVYILVLLTLGCRGLNLRHSASGNIVAAITLLLQTTTYYMIFLTLPHEFDLYLDTTLDRLAVQLWPSVVLLIFMVAEKKTAAVADVLPDREKTPVAATN